MKLIYSALLCLLLLSSPLRAELMVEKQRFSLPEFQTFNGNSIKQLTVGWESYGELSPAKDNVILITHYFTGTSHAAGKYHKDDKQAGYWDKIIGPGKAIDTKRFFVLSVDTPVNANVYDKNVITTGPATINPDTGKTYGLDFPVVTIRDFVNVQKALLESLGINKLYAVAGPSMGSFQAMEWATAYPDWVPRMISVIGAVQADAWTTAALEHWAAPITLDPLWLEGNYPKDKPPKAGLTQSLMSITQQALHPDFFNQVVKHSALEPGPLQDIRAKHKIVNWLQSRAQSRTAAMDANHILYLVRACQLFIAGHGSDLQKAMKNVKAKTLFLPATGDQLLLPYMAQLGHELMPSGQSQLVNLPGNMGHLDGLFNIQSQQQLIADFLSPANKEQP